MHERHQAVAFGAACEAFITNVRGWCVEHGFVLKLENEILFAGQLGNPTALCSHIDRYIIREDAKPNDLSPHHALLLLSSEERARCAAHFGPSPTWTTNNQVARTEIAGQSVLSASVTWLYRDGLVARGSCYRSSAVIALLSKTGVQLDRRRRSTNRSASLAFGQSAGSRFSTRPSTGTRSRRAIDQLHQGLLLGKKPSRDWMLLANCKRNSACSASVRLHPLNEAVKCCVAINPPAKSLQPLSQTSRTSKLL